MSEKKLNNDLYYFTPNKLKDLSVKVIKQG